MLEIIVLAIIVIFTVVILAKTIKRTKNGGCSCGGNCSSGCGGCQYSQKKDEEISSKKNDIKK